MKNITINIIFLMFLVTQGLNAEESKQEDDAAEKKEDQTSTYNIRR